MQTRIVTLRYDETVHGFPEDALQAVVKGRTIERISEHFFVYKDVPHLTLLLSLSDAAEDARDEKDAASSTDESEMSPESKAVFERLKTWRGEVAKAESKPSYVVAKNTQLERIARTMPKSMEELKTLAGLSSSFCEKRGDQVLKVIASASSADTASDSAAKPWWKLG